MQWGGNCRSKEDQYDPRGCITAAELRSSGIEIPASIPNAAWVPKSAIKFGEPTITSDKEKQIVHANLPVEIDAPFRWVTVEVELSE